MVRRVAMCCCGRARVAELTAKQTGIKRVEIENLLEEYRDKLDAQKLIAAENRK
jgi:hypothetical protein